MVNQRNNTNFQKQHIISTQTKDIFKTTCKALRVWLSKNQPNLLVEAIWEGPARPKNPLPTPPRGCGGRFSILGLRNPVS